MFPASTLRFSRVVFKPTTFHRLVRTRPHPPRPLHHPFARRPPPNPPRYTCPCCECNCTEEDYGTPVLNFLRKIPRSRFVLYGGHKVLLAVVGFFMGCNFVRTRYDIARKAELDRGVEEARRLMRAGDPKGASEVLERIGLLPPRSGGESEKD
jgi:hypothetical protein